MNTKLVNRPLYEDVAERLREQIFSHELAPGSWLDEQSLAAAFGISRTPMREAIKVLASEGLVTSKMNKGSYVTDIYRFGRVNVGESSCVQDRLRMGF